MKVEVNVDYGHIRLKIDEHLKMKGISKNKICTDLDIPRTNFNRYCNGNFQRLDEGLLCKLCWYLDITPGELIEYVKSEDKREVLEGK